MEVDLGEGVGLCVVHVVAAQEKDGSIKEVEVVLSEHIQPYQLHGKLQMDSNFKAAIAHSLH